MAEPESFTLTAPSCYLMDTDTCARSFHVSRQAFHKWSIQPVRIEGTRRLFDFAAVLRNRLEAAQEADTPADSEIDKLQARIDLAREQIERERIRNADAAAEYVPAGAAESALRALMAGVSEILTTIPNELNKEFPKIRPARELIERETRRCIQALYAAELETLEYEPEE